MPALIERRMLTARLVCGADLGQETSHLEFEAAEPFQFIPGQFISVTREHNGRELTRAYSLASAPRGDRRFDLCLNRVAQGFFSNFLCDMEAGGEIRFHGPHGFFTLANPPRDSIFVASGTGIAPIRGMVQWLFEDPVRHAEREFWLLFGARSEQAIYYDAEFRGLAQQFPQFHYLVTLSRASDSWCGMRGYVQDHLADIARGHENSDAYICGLKDMVTANRNLLQELGWERKSIHYERFD
jgi:ferredoxin-NADP reductase